jgi:hypothetical protein
MKCILYIQSDRKAPVHQYEHFYISLDDELTITTQKVWLNKGNFKVTQSRDTSHVHHLGRARA